MEITYIHHSSFLIEFDTVYLLFDYFEGVLPALEISKPLVVFSSHRHGDHFKEIIFDIAKQHEATSYVLSSDIPKKRVPSDASVLFMGPGETAEVKGMEIATYKSTDEGVAFVIKHESKILYYAGDLNHWYWKGEAEAWNSAMTKAYRTEIAKLPEELDVAFVPVDPRLEEYYSLGAKDLIAHCAIQCLVPMHFWGDFSVCKRLTDELAPTPVQIVQIDHTNQSWRIS